MTGDMIIPAGLWATPSEYNDLIRGGTMSGAVKLYLCMGWDRWANPTRRLYLRSTNIMAHTTVWGTQITQFRPYMGEHAIREAVKSESIAVQTLVFIRAVTAHAKKMGMSPADPLAGYKFTYPAKGWEEWTVEELNMVKTDTLVGEVIHFAALTGQRLGDILNLVSGDFTHMTVAIRQSKTGAHVVLPLTGKLTALSAVARAMALRSLTGAQLFKLFTFNNLHEFKYEYYKLTKAIGVKKPFHGLRKLCAIRMAEAGCTMPEIMAVTGHTSTATAAKYIRAADKYIMASRAMERVRQQEELNETA